MRRDVQQHEPGVDEVGPARRQLVGGEVHLTQPERGRLDLPQQRDIEIGGHDVPAGRHPLCQPARDRTVARAGLEATRASADADRLRSAERRRVVACLQ